MSLDGHSGNTGVDNARTRLVGAREDKLADAVVGLVRAWRAFAAWCVRAWRGITQVTTVVGVCVGALTVGALLTGYLAGWMEAVVFGWAGVALFVVAMLYLLGSVAYVARVHLPNPRVVVGSSAPVDVVVSNPTRRGLLAARVEVPVGDGVAEFAVPGLKPGTEFRDVFLVPGARRGVVTIGPVRSVRADPVGLMRRETDWQQTVELFVHPQTVALAGMSTGLVRDLEGSATHDLTTSDMSFHALREYAVGDERRHIHWRSTAKTGAFMVRQYEQTRRSNLLVALSLAETDFASDEEFELAVSAAASLGVRAVREDRSVSFVVSERTPEFAKAPVFDVRALDSVTPTRLLDALCRVDRVPSALRLPDVARVSADRTPDVSIAYLVCGSTVTTAQLRNAASSFHPGVEVVAVRCMPGDRPGLRRVGEVSILTIGFLDDLRSSLAKSRAA
ncbi:DUF58 domain-containing protein [Humibacter albus]|uniref:DUF58 domain-containing protein n=1 Tax=Humibacter albus TaxID=427754 RepID=UPI0003B6E353|nr:DUF58 domain-containing protein [Humibacter albus]